MRRILPLRRETLPEPDELLRQFAYDEQQGDNGERIKQCRRWSGETPAV